MKQSDSTSKNSLVWEWWEGAETTLADFGDPFTTTTHALCVYDRIAGMPALMWSLEVPPGGTCSGKPCWKERRGTYVYKDRTLAAQGVKRIRLRPGVDGEARVTVSAKGPSSAPPLPLADDPSVTVQMVNSIGTCWEATYSGEAINTAERFRDAND